MQALIFLIIIFDRIFTFIFVSRARVWYCYVQKLFFINCFSSLVSGHFALLAYLWPCWALEFGFGTSFKRTISSSSVDPRWQGFAATRTPAF